MGQVCPGYRNQTDLLFRNETKRIVQRARTSVTSSHSSSGSSDDGGTPSPPIQKAETMLPSPPTSTTTWATFESQTPVYAGDLALYSPAVPQRGLAHLGLNYFASHFSYTSPGASLDYLAYASDIMYKGGRGANMLEPAINAAGLAALANVTGNRSIIRSARSCYIEALQATNDALRDPVRFTDDATVVSTLLLGLFESMTCIGSDSFQAWTRHIQGATNLLLHRGVEQCSTPLGQHIFQEVSSQLIASCTRIFKPFPESVLRLRNKAMQRYKIRSPSWMLSVFYIELVGIFNKICVSAQEPMLDDWEEMLNRALELNDQITALFNDLPDMWSYKIHRDESANPDIVYNGVWHEFKDMWVGRYLNSMRSSRMFLGITILCLAHREWSQREPAKLIRGKTYRLTVTEALVAMNRARDEVFASTPLMMGYVRDGKVHSTSALESSHTRLRGTNPVDKQSMAMGCYFMFWHLYVAGSLSINTMEARRWTAARLREIRRIAGIQKTIVLAQAIDYGISMGHNLTDETMDIYMKGSATNELTS